MMLFVEYSVVAVKADEDAVASVVCPDTVRAVAVVVAKVEVPVTAKTPEDRVLDDRVVTNAFVVVELPTMSDVRLASVATSEEKNPVVLVLLVIVPLVE